MNPLPAFMTHFTLIFLSKLFIVFKVVLFTNPSTLSLAKGIAAFVSNFFPRTKRPTRLNHCRYLSFTKFFICRHIVSEDISYVILFYVFFVFFVRND